MKCPVCGAEASDGDLHCTQCGARLDRAAPPEAQLLLKNLRAQLKGMRESLQTISFQVPPELQKPQQQQAPVDAVEAEGEEVDSLDYRVFLLEGKRAGESFDVGRIITFGRAHDCEVQLTDIAVSREHCRIVFHPERRVYILQDLGSHNGTILNGKPIRRAELKTGDTFEVGETLVMFYKVPMQPELVREVTRRGLAPPDEVTGAEAEVQEPERTETDEESRKETSDLPRREPDRGESDSLAEPTAEEAAQAASESDAIGRAVTLDQPLASDRGAGVVLDDDDDDDDMATVQIPAFRDLEALAAAATGAEQAAVARPTGAEDIGNAKTELASPIPDEPQAQAAAEAQAEAPAEPRASEAPSLDIIVESPDPVQTSGDFADLFSLSNTAQPVVQQAHAPSAGAAEVPLKDQETGPVGVQAAPQASVPVITPVPGRRVLPRDEGELDESIVEEALEGTKSNAMLWLVLALFAAGGIGLIVYLLASGS